MNRKRNSTRRGITLIYVIIAMPVMLGAATLAVDFGYVELNKFQLQQVADASAHDYMVLYAQYGTQAAAQSHISTTKNASCSINGAQPTVTPTWGYWNPATQTFSTSSTTGSAPAVKVVVSYKTANSNALPLLFGTIIGRSTLDMSASAVAASIGTTSAVTVSATSNPYLAGMPSTATTVWGDTVASNGATQASSIPVVPGSFITFTGITGTTSIIFPSMPYYGPNGSTGPNGTATQHGQNWDGPILSASTDNGIANAIMPESSFMGLFLDNSQPDSTSAPTSTVDWTQAAVKNQTSFTNLALKTPFFIGDGSYNSTTQTFQVPPGATRLFLGIWDGVEYNNNTGSLSGTVTVKNQIVIVQ